MRSFNHVDNPEAVGGISLPSYSVFIRTKIWSGNLLILKVSRIKVSSDGVWLSLSFFFNQYGRDLLEGMYLVSSLGDKKCHHDCYKTYLSAIVKPQALITL